MGCIVLVLAVLAPRVALVLIFLLTDWFSQTFGSIIWPVLGFIFMPYTTLAWMGGMLSGGIQGGWALLLVLAVIVDLLHLAGGGRHYHIRHRGHVHHVEP
jgi:hypothetical protein